MKRKMRIPALLAALALLMALCGGCQTAGRSGSASGLAPSWGGGTGVSASPGAAASPEDGSWAIYWYICGTDLESDGGAATEDIREMMAVDLPENVTVVAQTGGTEHWQNNVVDGERLERFVYDSGGKMERVDSQPLASMGDPETLADFLTFCRDNYPADKTALIFWNHGGGSVSGVAFDELFDYDSLSLGEIYEALNAVYELSDTNPPLEFVGFDACLMATVDTAYTLCDAAKYMIASEESEPGTGWDYTGLYSALAADPGLDGAELGVEICDSYYAQSMESGWGEETTLSLVDLGKIQPLIEAYDGMGAELLAGVCENPEFFSRFGRCAVKSENYGGNTQEEGYTNLVDLGDLARNAEELLPRTAPAVMAALEDCVLYQVKGEYRSSASGLSCYYSYNGDEEDMRGWLQVSPSEAFSYLYSYELEGEMDPAGEEYVAAMGYDLVPDVADMDDLGLEDAPLYIDDTGSAVMDIGPEKANMLKSVNFELCYFDVEEDIILALGFDDDMFADWENGVFTDNFRGVWGALDGHIVYMELSDSASYYNIYNVPILLNGEDYNLRVAYDFNIGEYKILGARQAIDGDSGMADKNVVQLKEGDVITTLHYGSTISGDDELQEFEAETFTISGRPEFTEEWLGDGTYGYMFEMTGPMDESYLSQIVAYTIEGDNIYTELL